MTEPPELDDTQPPVEAADEDLVPAPEAPETLEGTETPEAAEESEAAEEPDPADERLQRIEEAIAGVEVALRDANELAVGRQKVIDRLHEENQRLRTGERQLLLRPVLTDLYRLHLDLLRQATAMPEQATREQVVSLLDSFAHSVEFALERCGVRVVRPNVGDAFDPHAHRVADVTAADAPEQDGQVTGVVSAGYLDTVAERMLATAVVQVARWTAPTQPEPEAPEPEPAPAPETD
ncbi:nucleotide exchange factor GrpE [Flindersiella endophytica]